ncbi:MAG: ISAs1 family transposase [Treponema sp.]|nr:ISAs1 family transposase [Treponema sp.]
MGWEELIDALDEIETEVEYDGYFCSVRDAVVIVTLGSLCELKSVMRIHAWASTQTITSFLEKEFGIMHIPCYGWLTELLALIKPESLNRCMMKFVNCVCPELVAELEKRLEKQNRKKKWAMTVAIDGKTVRATAKMAKYDSPLHIISAYASEIGITLAQNSVRDKSNEIPAVQELIKTLEIEGCMVVADALNCQVGTAKAVLEAKADYLLCAKDNQPALKKDIEEYVKDEKLRKSMDTFSKTEKGHGRIETRTAFTTNDVSWMPGGREWPGMKCIGAIKTHFEYKDRITEEWHYYISSKELSAEALLHHARMEWGVETMHWLLDVRYGEDCFRAQHENLQKNMNMSRKLALNIARIFKDRYCPKKPMSHVMFDCQMNPYHLLDVLGKN